MTTTALQTHAPPLLSIFFLLHLQLLLLIPLAAAKVPAIIVFGDSSVDAGNNNQISTVLKSNFEPYGRDFAGRKPTGRFSNGRIPPDFISEAFGLKPTVPAYLDPSYTIADFTTGVCFASAGTGFDNVTSDVLKVIPLWKELEYYKEYQTKLRDYLGDIKANQILNDALYVMSLGTNDFLENYYTLPTRRNQFTVGQFGDFLLGIAENFIMQLYDLGARKISLAGLPPMGCLPMERAENAMNGRACVDEYNLVAWDFNNKLSNVAAYLNGKLSGINVVISNPYDVFVQLIQSPSSYGYDVTGVACCGTGTYEMGYMCDKYNPFTCKDADKYVFWDSFHPTEKTNRIVTQHLLPRLLSEFK
uniref:GDSL esterase/lipase n=1 Tax=Kalanchoe fedtschenkoi TaxID=63787 RepID=A0A7N0TAK2_KALFE